MKKILLIEDNVEISENTAEILELQGYNVTVANNGMDGIAKAKILLPDIIICDIVMPEANGHEVIKQLKSDVNTSNIPFVFISASIQKKQINACLEMGADAFVIKPFDVAELLNTLKTCLEKNRLE